MDLFEALQKNATERLLAEKQLVMTQAALHRPSLNIMRQALLTDSMRRARERLIALREQRKALLQKKVS